MALDTKAGIIVLQELPPSVLSFDGVSVDAKNESLVFCSIHKLSDCLLLQCIE